MYKYRKKLKIESLWPSFDKGPSEIQGDKHQQIINISFASPCSLFLWVGVLLSDCNHYHLLT